MQEQGLAQVGWEVGRFVQLVVEDHSYSEVDG